MGQHMQSQNYFHNHMRSDVGHQSYNDKGGNHNYEYSPQRFDHLKSQTDGFVDGSGNIENNSKYDNNTNNNNNNIIPNQNSNTSIFDGSISTETGFSGPGTTYRAEQ